MNKQYFSADEIGMNTQASKPLILQRADPYIIKHDGMYYFTASVPEYDRIELRSSATLAGLASAKPKTVWRKHASGIMSEHVWAPELHFIDGLWYIYFAASSRENIWELRPYVLQGGTNPMNCSWNEMGMIKAAPDDNESFTDFSLDATTFCHRGKRYLIWAEKIGHQFGVSNLYIAQMSAPDALCTKRVLISTPEYDWEKIDFCVNEGAAVIKRGGKINVAFSASATGAMYCMGLLQIDEDGDLLNPKQWRKRPHPIFGTSERHRLFGPGHNCFTEDEKGADICVFHARQHDEIVGDPLYDPNRHTFLMRVDFDESGAPIFRTENIIC